MGGRGSSYSKQKFIDWLSHEGTGSGKPPQPIDISKFQGQSLEQVEARLRVLKHEELFVFDEKGTLVEAYKGGADSVAFPTDLLQRPGVTVTHGHPKGAQDFGGTFSFADMKNMLTSQWAEHRATASGRGEMNYILRRTAKADSKGFYNRINRDYKRLEAKIDAAWDKGYNEAKAKGVPAHLAIRAARQRSVGVLNRYYKTTAAQYGYEYVTRKDPYHYGR